MSSRSVSGCVLFQAAPQLPGSRHSFPQATGSRYPWLVIHSVQKDKCLLANCFWVITNTLQLFKNKLHNSHTVNLTICVSQKHGDATKRLAKKIGQKNGWICCNNLGTCWPCHPGGAPGVTCFNFVVRVLICSLYDSSLWLAYGVSD